jgi:hypothetical protein
MRVIDPEHSQVALLAEKATAMYADK